MPNKIKRLLITGLVVLALLQFVLPYVTGSGFLVEPRHALVEEPQAFALLWLEYILAPWFEVTLGLLILLSLSSIPWLKGNRKWLRGLQILIAVFIADATYKSAISYWELPFYREYARWIHPGLPLNLRRYELRVNAKANWPQAPVGIPHLVARAFSKRPGSATPFSLPKIVPSDIPPTSPSAVHASPAEPDAIGQHSCGISANEDVSFQEKPTLLENLSDKIPGTEMLSFKVFKVGIVQKGPCQGADFLLIETAQEEPCKLSAAAQVTLGDHEFFSQDSCADSSSLFYRVIRDAQQLTVIEKISAPVASSQMSLQWWAKNQKPEKSLSLDPSSVVPSLELPGSLTVADAKIALKKPQAILPSKYDGEKFNARFTKLDTIAPWGDVFISGRDVVIPRKDGTWLKYDVSGLTPQVEGYVHRETVKDAKTLADKIVKDEGLSKSNGHEVFARNGLSDPVLKSAFDKYRQYVSEFNAALSEAKKNCPSGATNGDFCQTEPMKVPALEEFVALKPFAYTRDKLGRWHQHHKLVMAPPSFAEPLIYVYAPEPNDVRIELPHPIRVTASFPEYRNLWLVETQADGRLKDLSTGRSYPYLFWEGTSYLVPSPSKGWVVSKSEVQSFLEGALLSYGLQGREIKDFVRYWVPRMQSSPYYLISFLDPKLVELLMPLDIEPKPETLIRVHMDFRELAQPVRVTAPTSIVTPQRKGLTVVEWGGLIH